MTMLMAPYLDMLLTLAEDDRTFTFFKQAKSCVSHALFNSTDKSSAQRLAEFCALKILDSLLHEKSIHHNQELTPQFMHILTSPEYKFKTVHAVKKYNLHVLIEETVLLRPDPETHEIKKCTFGTILKLIM